MDKYSSLLRTFVNYGRKKFYNIGPWLLAKVLKVYLLNTKTRSKDEKLEELERHFFSLQTILIEFDQPF
jgi:hypothetical protein